MLHSRRCARLLGALLLVFALRTPVRAEGADPDLGLINDYVMRGNQALRQGKQQEALTAWAMAYALRPNALALFQMAEACRKAGRDHDALVLFQRALLEDPQSALANVVKSQLQRLRGSLAGQPPRDVDVAQGHVNHGVQRFRAGDFAAAQASLALAYAVYPTKALILYNLGKTCRNLGAHREALALFGRFLHEDATAPQRGDAESQIAAVQAELAAARAKEAEAAARAARAKEAEAAARAARVKEAEAAAAAAQAAKEPPRSAGREGALPRDPLALPVARLGSRRAAAQRAPRPPFAPYVEAHLGLGLGGRQLRFTAPAGQPGCSALEVQTLVAHGVAVTGRVNGSTWGHPNGSRPGRPNGSQAGRPNGSS